MTLPGGMTGSKSAGAAAARRRAPAWLGLLVAGACAATTLLAMRQTSTTFDEIVLIAGGARGFATGQFDLAPEHPPVMQYLYGLPAYLARPSYPDETGVPTEARRAMGYRYLYARNFFFEGTNDPEQLAFVGRLPAVLCVLLLVLLVYSFVSRNYGPGAGALAALLTGFMPDVLAHGGVAYNDLPLALATLATIVSVDEAAREPTPRAGAVAGALFALALGIKFSAVALAPIALLILASQAVLHRGDRAWLRAAGGSVIIAAIAAYATLVLIYRGDFALAEARYGLDFTFHHVTKGHGSPGYLLGNLNPLGWWYFFPVAFLFKTPASLHILLLIGLLGFVAAMREERGRNTLASPLRAPLAGIAVLGGALLTSNLVIGFRYALPVLPLVCIVIAVGVATAWRRARPFVRVAIVGTTIWFAASSISYYPHFLAYVSEFGPGRDHEHEVLLDSSLDWGQGLLALREWMDDTAVERVYLSYFGSAWPEGYGIRYQPLLSFFPLPAPQPASVGETEPSHVVISATNLHGVYLPGDPWARFREVRPDTVLAHTLFVYRLR